MLKTFIFVLNSKQPSSFPSWDEFQQIGLGEEMARRIFREVQVEPGKLSLDQFQHLANWRGPLDS